MIGLLDGDTESFPAESPNRGIPGRALVVAEPDKARFTLDVSERDHAPDPRICGVVSIVPHDEDVAFGDGRFFEVPHAKPVACRIENGVRFTVQFFVK